MAGDATPVLQPLDVLKWRAIYCEDHPLHFGQS
jgi:hypothetical protein